MGLKALEIPYDGLQLRLAHSCFTMSAVLHTLGFCRCMLVLLTMTKNPLKPCVNLADLDIRIVSSQSTCSATRHIALDLPVATRGSKCQHDVASPAWQQASVSSPSWRPPQTCGSSGGCLGHRQRSLPTSFRNPFVQTSSCLKATP